MGDAVENIHGTVIALGSHAALIRGAPGSGKSDLALRCLAAAPTAIIPSPAVLVADDRVQISCTEGRLTAEAPATIRGKLEVRGLGIMTVPYLASAELALVAELTAPQRIERFPDPQPATDLMSVHLPVLYLAPFEAAAHVKLLLALVATFKRAPTIG